MKTKLLGAALLTLLAAACQRSPQLETRTFPIAQLQPYEVEALIAPYVYMDRPDHPGVMSTSERAVTVRETADNLDKIERVLAEYDKARPDMRLTFQVIEADGFTASDPKIAAVEEELRKIFQFKGYRLVAEAVLTAGDGSEIQQALGGAQADLSITGDVRSDGGTAVRLQDIRLWEGQQNPILQTTVSVRPGQTLVLGTSPKKGSSATLLLTVHAELAGA